MEIDKNILNKYITNVLKRSNISINITSIYPMGVGDDHIIYYSFISNDKNYHSSIYFSTYIKYYRKYKLEEFLNII